MNITGDRYCVFSLFSISKVPLRIFRNGFCTILNFFCRCNIEINQYKEKSEMEISKLKAITKRLEIENAALQTSVEQKTKECLALAALFDEVTGKKN